MAKQLKEKEAIKIEKWFVECATKLPVLDARHNGTKVDPVGARELKVLLELCESCYARAMSGNAHDAQF